MGRTVETAAVETKSSLALLTTYRPLRFTWPVQPGSLDGPGVARGMKKIGFLLMSSGRCSAVANSVASPPAEPDIRRRAGQALATQCHITGAVEELPPCTVSGMGE
jgi:hypothetical protein